MNLNVKQVKNHFYVSEGRKIYSHDIAPIINCREDKVMWQSQCIYFEMLVCYFPVMAQSITVFCHYFVIVHKQREQRSFSYNMHLQKILC